MTFYTEDATRDFLEPSSVDLFITNPPFYGIHAAEYGNKEKQIHSSGGVDDFVDNLVDITLAMERALRQGGNILMILPNKPFIFDYITKLATRTSLNFGQLLVWDLLRDVSAIDNYSAVVVNLYSGDVVNSNNRIIKLPIAQDPLLSGLQPIGYIWDALPKEIYTLLIENYSNHGDTVADIMGGTGTICISAVDTGRKFIYNDVSKSQTDLAKTRHQLYIDSHME
jgi:DNA modification methylase